MSAQPPVPARESALPPIPPEVSALAASLRAAGRSAWLVGGCVRDWLRGATVHDFDLVTSATPEEVLALFPCAIPTGLRHGTVTVPTRAGPVDVTRLRAGPSLEADLAHRDFTVNAIAMDPETGTLCDPFGGRADLRAGRLRGVGDAAERLAEDPLRALRAGRLVATLGLRADAALVAALPSAAAGLAAVARERIRAELDALLAGQQAGAGLALLAAARLCDALAPGVRADAPAVVAALPADLDLRLAAWLRGTRVAAVLASLRIPRRRARRVALLLRIHPVDAAVDPASDTSLRRLLQRAGDADADALVALRRAEIEAAEPAGGAAAKATLRAIAEGLWRVRSAGALALHRLDLALDGNAVIGILGTGPGPHVGEALRFLTERVLEDPARNTPEALAALLADWRPSRPLRAGRRV